MTTSPGHAAADQPPSGGTARPIGVLLADDHAAIRAGMRLMLEQAPDIVVVGEAADGAVALRQATALRPDVVLMDIRMPGTDGIMATREITSAGLADVLILTTFDLDEYVFGALRAGAAGFLLKTVEPAVLIDAVRRVAAGDGFLAPEVTRRLLNAFATGHTAGTATASAAGVAGRSAAGPAGAGGRSAAGSAGAGGRSAAGSAGGSTVGAAAAGTPAGMRMIGTLTDRERDVLAALGRGLSNAGLAAALTISEKTAKTHVSRVLAKLGCASRVQAAILAKEAGLA